MKKIRFTGLFALLALAASAQTLAPKVTSTAGGSVSSGGVSLSFTIGETLTPTFLAAGQTLTQGQQQPEIDLLTASATGDLCPGGQLEVAYSATGFVAAANVFTLQLSDGGGSFAAPLALGTLNGTVGGSFVVTIPNGSYPGSGYRVRVVSSHPVFAGTEKPIAVCTCTMPVATCKPASLGLNAAGQAALTVADINDGSAFGCGLQAISASLTALTCAHLGPNPVVLTITDVHNQVSTCTTTVAVFDLLVPVISCPGAVTVSCSANVPAVSLAAVTATDNCGAPVKSHVGDGVSNQTCANRKTITRTYQATDGSGNSNICAQVITVYDSTLPVFTSMPANVTVQCSSIPAVGTPSASDGCGGSVSVAYNGQTTAAGTCPDSYLLTRQWTATDVCGNTKTATQRISVIDTQQPNFTGTPANVTVQCDAVPSPATPSATDNCDTAVAITYNGQTQTTGTCTNAYALTRRWTATDNCGNTRSISQRITVVDNGKPTFTTFPANATVSCTDPIPTVGAPTATDGCGAATVTYLGQTTISGTCPTSYQIRRTWRATDACGNSTAATQTIQVSDTGAPMFTSVPGPLTIECTETIPTLVNPTATDACGGYAFITFLGQVASGCSADYTITRTWQASDLCGNTATTTQLITVLGNNFEEEGAENRASGPPGRTTGGRPTNLVLQPNPTTDQIILDLTDFSGEAVTVSIHSDLGKLIWERRIPTVEDLKQPVSMREAGAAAGGYTVSVRSTSGVVAKRVVLAE
ncbi:MAG: hypothetical protein ABMA02_00115 [Saprospiraceae bacterium]